MTKKSAATVTVHPVIGAPLYSEAAFVAAAAENAVAPDCAVLKGYTSTVTAIKAHKGAKPRYKFKISTAGIDRDRDVIDVAGWDLANYQKNPVVLFGHQYGALPVGTSIVTPGKGSLDADMEFVDAEVYPFAETVRRMVEAKILRAASVGFRPKKYAYNEERRGVDIMEAELLEWSIVPVPANPECLVQLAVMPKGIVDGFAAGCEQLLAACKGQGSWVVGVDLAKAVTVEVDHERVARAVASEVLQQISRFRTTTDAKDAKDLPTPTGDESEEDFVSRCMADATMQSEYPDPDQRAAVCYSQYRGKAAQKAYPGCTREGGCPTNETGSPENCPMADCPMKRKPEHQAEQADADDVLLKIDMADDPTTLVLEDEESYIDATGDEVTLLVGDMIAAGIKDAVQTEVVRALNHARGRID